MVEPPIPPRRPYRATPAVAKWPCRDAQGKFTKCPDKPTKCRDAKGRFTKCVINSGVDMWWIVLVGQAYAWLVIACVVGWEVVLLYQW